MRARSVAVLAVAAEGRAGHCVLLAARDVRPPGELAELCDAVGIIEQGKLLFSGGVSEAMQQADVGQTVVVGVEARPEEAANLLRQVAGIRSVEVKAAQTEATGHQLEVSLDPESGLPISEVAARLVAQGYRITELRKEQVNLETAFMRLTRGISL